jgi:putative membrane protein
LSGIEAFAVVAPFLGLVSRGFRLAVGRRARLLLPAFTLKDPPVSGGVSFLSCTIFFFFGTDFIVDGFNSFIVHRPIGKCFLALLESRSRFRKVTRMRHFVFRWIVTTIAVFVAAPIVGINYGDRLGCLLGASLLLGIINAFVRPVLLLLSLPLILVTLGIFILIINALMLKFVGEIMPCFEVPGFWRAFFGAIIISIVSWLLSAFFRGSDGRVHVLTHHSQIKRVRGRVIER